MELEGIQASLTPGFSDSADPLRQSGKGSAPQGAWLVLWLGSLTWGRWCGGGARHPERLRMLVEKGGQGVGRRAQGKKLQERAETGG